MKAYLFLLLTAIAVSLRAELLDPAGRPYREIVISEKAPATVRLAANELRTFLAKRCGAELVVTTTPTAVPFILAGDSPALREAGLSPDSFPEEGYAMKTSEDFLALYGRDYGGPPVLGNVNPWRGVEAYNRELKLCAFGEAGTLTAVYEFLQQICGIRFYMPGDLGTFLPPCGDVRVPALDIMTAPRTRYRYPWFSMFEYSPESALWSRRIGFGGKAPVMIIHSYCRFQRFRDTHPDYFALTSDGKRAFGSECAADGKGHLCLTNPDVIRQWAEDIIAFFRSHPEYDVYPLVPQDGLYLICACPSCSAELRPDQPGAGRFSYHIWNFTCRVAALVGQVFPDKYVGCLAYEKYRIPPQEIETMPNVAVMFCCKRGAMANSRTSVKLREEIEAWSKKVDRIYLWNWYLDNWLPWTGLPVFYDDAIERELKWLFENPKYQGEFIEAENQGGTAPGLRKYASMNTPALQHWNLYVTARLHQHPDLDIRREYGDFCRNFYGPAEVPMRRFRDLCRDMRNQAFDRDPSPTPDMVYTPATMRKLQDLLSEAEKAAADSPVHLARIKMLSEEFEQGAKRLLRLSNTGRAILKVPKLKNGTASLANVLPEPFHTKGGENAVPPTWMYAGYDRQFLYFRFLCYEPEMDSLVAKVESPGQGEIWMDDSLELFLAPDETRREDCFHLIINTRGVVDSGHFPFEQKGFRDSRWDAHAEVRVQKEPGRWILDVKLPLAAVGIQDPGFAGDLAGNFFRNRLGQALTLSTCWIPTGENKHFLPAKFGVIQFQK